MTSYSTIPANIKWCEVTQKQADLATMSLPKAITTELLKSLPSERKDDSVSL